MSLMRWSDVLPHDPVPWLLESDEAAARWVTLTEVLGAPADAPEVEAAHAAVLATAQTADLLGRLADWEAPQVIGGHDSPIYSPNLVGLILDTGVAPDDDPRLGRLAGQMLAHADDEGRFTSFFAPRGQGEPRWSALQCDTFAIAGALVRLGHARDDRVVRALARMEADVCQTAQGRAWECRPDPASGFRGPGRKHDFCPMLVVEALRVHADLPAVSRPAGLLESGRVLLRAWRERGVEKPYLFGHGRQFKTVKWPSTWYGAYAVLDAVGRHPGLWDAGAPSEDRRAVAELAACLIAYNVARDGTVTPRSARRGFDGHSFGQKRQPSAWATARVCAVLTRLQPLAPEIAAVDVLALGSSKGGSGTARPPRIPLD